MNNRNCIDHLLSHWLLAAALILVAAALTIPQIDRLAFDADSVRQFMDAYGPRLLGESYTPFAVLDSLNDTQQPLSHLLLHFWGYAVGHSPSAARLLFIFAGLLSLAMVYRLAHDFTTPIAASFAVFAVLCCAFYFRYFAQIRFYTLVVLFASLLLWVYLRISDARRQPPPHNYLALVLAGCALMMTHGFSFIIVIAIALYHLLVRKKDRRWLQVTAAGFVVLALLSPLLYRMATAGLDLARQNKAAKADHIGDILSTWLSVFSNGSPLFLALVVMAAIMGWRRGYLRGAKPFLLLPLFIVAIVCASVFAGFLSVNDMRYFLVGMPILVVFYASGFYALYRLRRWLGLLVAFLWLGAGLHFVATGDWSTFAGHIVAAHSRAPWHLISRHMRQSDDPLLALEFALDENALDNGSRLLRTHYFGQYGLEVQNRSAHDIEGRISGAALERPGYWILFQHGFTDQQTSDIVTDTLEKNGYMNCERETFPNNVVMHTYRWKSLQCDTQPKSTFATAAGAIQHYGAVQEDAKLLFAGLWQPASDAPSDALNVSFQLLDGDWHNHAQIDLPVSSLFEMRQFHFNLSELPAGDYRLMVVVYDAQTGEKQTWRGNEGWIPEMQLLAELEITD